MENVNNHTIDITYFVCFGFFLLLIFLVYKAYDRMKNKSIYQTSVSYQEIEQQMSKEELEQDRRVTKNWLLSFFIFGIVYFIQNLSTPEFHMLSEILGTYLSLRLFIIIFPSIGFLLIYWGSYIKRGKIILGIEIVWLFICVIASLINIASTDFEFHSFDFYIFIMFSIIQFLYFITSIKLYKANSLYKSKIILAKKAKLESNIVVK